MAVNLADQIRTLDNERYYIAPQGFEIKSIPRPTFQPDIPAMLTEIRSTGYFTDTVGMRFYIPDLANKKEAKYQLQLAIDSTLPALKLILEQNLTPITVTRKEIIYISPVT